MVISSALVPCVVVVILGVFAMLWASRTGQKRAEYIGKPLASAAFVTLALSQGALDHALGQTLLAGLVLCALGDVLLMPADPRAFLGGIGAFLLGHVAFAIAFAQRGVSWGAAGLAALALLLVVVPVLRWLLPHVARKQPALRGAVLAYVGVITAMVALAFGTTLSSSPADPRWAGAAAAFFISDLAVAHERFVSDTRTSRIWGLPLYFGSTLAFAAFSGPP